MRHERGDRITQVEDLLICPAQAVRHALVSGARRSRRFSARSGSGPGIFYASTHAGWSGL